MTFRVYYAVQWKFMLIAVIYRGMLSNYRGHDSLRDNVSIEH